MNSDSANPYAPPTPLTTKPSLEKDIDGWPQPSEPIVFSGRVSQRGLEDYLRADGHIGCVGLSSMAIGCGGILLIFATQFAGLHFGAFAAGSMGILMVVVTVSTLKYRKLVYQTSNPEWNDPVQGSVQVTGIRLHRGFSTTFYQWDWYGDAVASTNMIGLLPATQLTAPLLITREMAPSDEDWGYLQQVAGVIRSSAARSRGGANRRDDNLTTIKNPRRSWTIEPPRDAIKFSGLVQNRDLARLPNRDRVRQRPLRTHFVIYSLVGFGGVLLAGCSGLLFEQVAILPVLAGLYFVAAILIGRRRQALGGEVFYLKGYAFDDGLVTDFGLAVSETTWPGLKRLTQDEDRMVLRRQNIDHFIIIRRDMFEDETAWDRFRVLIDTSLPIQ